LYQLPAHPAWNSQGHPGHWLKHGLLPLLLIAGLLVLPNPWLREFTGPLFPTVELTLIPDTTPEPVADPMPEPTPQPLPEPEPTQVITPKAISEPATQPPAKPGTLTANPPLIESQPAPSASSAAPAKPAITSGDILLMTHNRTSIEITPEFQARTGPARDFYIPKQDIENWLDDIPYLDESVDRPTVEMRFYAAGIEGQIEKFFDKITISKTFTTKYGTKIHCALIGVVAACGWK
jgi:hypothetical protein